MQCIANLAKEKVAVLPGGRTATLRGGVYGYLIISRRLIIVHACVDPETLRRQV